MTHSWRERGPEEATRENAQQSRDQGLGATSSRTTGPFHLLCPKSLEPPVSVGPPLEPRWALQVLLIICGPWNRAGVSGWLSEGWKNG